MAATTTTAMRQQFRRIAAAWPVDPFRTVQLKTFFESLAEHPNLTPQAVSAANALQNNEFQKKFAVSDRTLRPASMPHHYERLVEGFEKSAKGIGRPWWKIFFRIWHVRSFVRCELSEISIASALKSLPDHGMMRTCIGKCEERSMCCSPWMESAGIFIPCQPVSFGFWELSPRTRDSLRPRYRSQKPELSREKRSHHRNKDLTSLTDLYSALEVHSLFGTAPEDERRPKDQDGDPPL